MSNVGHSRSLARFGLAGQETTAKAARSLTPAEMFCWAGIVVGGLLILGGLCWKLQAKAADVWTPQQAAEYEAASQAMHCLANEAADHSHGAHSSSHDHQHGEASLEAIQRFEQIEDELEAALYRRDVLGIRVMQFGMLAVVGFGLGLRSINNQQSG